MKHIRSLTVFLPLVAFAMIARAQVVEVDRSPRDVALTPDARWAVTANHTSNSASLVDLANGEVVAEAKCGRKPFALALAADGKRAVVTNWFSYSITVLDVAPPSLRVVAEIPVGPEPRGVALSHDGKFAFVAIGVANEVAVVDLDQRAVVNRIATDREPWYLAASPDGKWLVVGNSGGESANVIDLATQKIVREVRIFGANIRQIAITADSKWAYLTHTGERGFGTSEENIERGWVIANRVSRIPLDHDGPKEALALDPAGRAAGDSEGVAVSPDGKWVAVAAAGSHELLLFKLPLPFVPYGGPGDHMEQELLLKDGRFRWVALGGRPLSARFTPDSKSVVVANYLSNSLQIVDAETAKLKETIGLGGPPEPSLARRGEAIFFDAQRSLQQWFSCHTCHAEGHTNHANFDTLNDGRYGNPKKTLSLRGVTHTGPWTWHGVQKSLEDSILNSLKTTMHSPPPGPDDAKALVAFFGTLDYPSNPYRQADGTLTDSAKRGEAIFQNRGCVRCHAGPHFASPGIFEVGTGDSSDFYDGYNPPSLRNVYDRAPYLHDARARSLEELLKLYHRPEKLAGGDPLKADELKDLVEYVKSL